MSESIGIIGGGITGLTLARFLYERGISCRLYEKSKAIGGVMQSYRQGEWLAESGPNTFLVKSPAVESFLQQTSIASKRIFASDTAQKRYIVRDGTLHPLPSGPLSFIKSGLFSTRAKLRLLKEPFVGTLADGKDESVASFVRRRLGPEFLDYAINPFVAGIYAGDPKQLSLRYTFKRMLDLEQQYGSLFLGQLRGKKKRKQRDRDLPDENRIFSFPEGMGQLPAELVHPMREQMHLGTTVSAIRKSQNSGGYKWELKIHQNGESRKVHHDTLICTVPLHQLSQINFEINREENLDVLGEVYYPPVSVWTMGVRRSQLKHPLDGFGMLVPEKERRSILGTLFSSSCFPNRAPEDGATLTTFLGGARQPDIARKSEEDQKALILDELRDLLGLQDNPVFERAVHWEHAIPQYELGYERIRKSLSKLEEANGGLRLTGSFRSGASINDCMNAGIELGQELTEHADGD